MSYRRYFGILYDEAAELERIVEKLRSRLGAPLKSRCDGVQNGVGV